MVLRRAIQAQRGVELGRAAGAPGVRAVIAVAGATGLLGGAICRRLAAAGESVRALARPTADPARVEALRRAGVALARGDLADRASLDALCAGASAVISTASSTLSRQPGDSIQAVDLEGQIRLIEAARAASVPRFVLVSFAPMPLDFPLQRAKLAVEQRLQESGMEFTILRPTFFMEVWLSPALGFDPPGRSARVYGGGERPISWIALDDVAAFAAGSLGAPRARGATLELGGPEALSPLEVIRIFEDIARERFAIERVPEEALRSRLHGAVDPLERSIAGLMCGYALGQAIDIGPALAAVPLRLTSVREHAARALSTTARAPAGARPR